MAAGRKAIGLGLGTLILIGCSDQHARDGGLLGSAREPIQSSLLGAYYDLAFKPVPSLTVFSAAHASFTQDQIRASFLRELAMQGQPYWSSGAAIFPALTGTGGTALFAPAPADSRIRYSCGATLISPSYVITAGHCVTPDSDLDAVVLYMYRPTAALAKNYVPAALSGTFPSYTQPDYAAADGYLRDDYACTVVTRCLGTNNLNCPGGTNDVGLMHCSGRPGDKYGFVNMSSGDPTGREALMHWKHEVLDLGGPDSSLPQD
ncbi:MAG TPA: trypsin-like serine protease, partial [Polyangiaceae bacterium]